MQWMFPLTCSTDEADLELKLSMNNYQSYSATVLFKKLNTIWNEIQYNHQTSGSTIRNWSDWLNACT